MYYVAIKDGPDGTLLREYLFEETSGTNVPDTSGNGADGTLFGDGGNTFWSGN